MTSAYHSQQLPPSGVDHAVFAHLASSSSSASASASKAPQPKPWLAHRGWPVTQLVTARDDLLRIYEVRQKTPALAAQTASSSPSSLPADQADHVVRLYLVREHRLFGSVSGLRAVTTTESHDDGRDRLLVSFKDAKIALLEWSDAAADLETVSIHTYERATQLSAGLPSNFAQILAVDPASRCAALLLPLDSMAVLPFYQDMSDLDFYDIDQAAEVRAVDTIDSLPYSPSFVLSFHEVDSKIRDVKDFCFLPGFQKPTVAVLFEQPRTWTGRLTLQKDTHSVYLFTLDLTASIAGQVIGSGLDAEAGLHPVHPVLTTSSDLPSDCLYLVPCPPKLGGVMVVSSSALVHVDQSGRAVVTAVNDWVPLISSASPAESTCKVKGVTDLHSSQLVFTDATEGLLTLRDGTFCRFSCLMDGRSVGAMRLERVTAGEETASVQAAAPSASLLLSDGSQSYLLNASLVGDSTLFRCAKVEKLLDKDEQEAVGEAAAAGAAGDGRDEMDLDLDDDLYGDSTKDGIKAEKASKIAYKEVLQLSEVDRIAAYGPILDLATRQAPAFGDGDVVSGSRKQIVACTGFGTGAGLTYFEPTLTPRKKRRLDTRSSDRIWRIIAGNGGQSKNSSGGDSGTTRGVSFLCSAEHQDVSELIHLNQDGSSAEVREVPGRTLAAGPLSSSRNRWAKVTASELCVLEADGFAVQTIAIEQAEVVSSSIEEGEYATLQLSDGSWSLYRYDDGTGQLAPLAHPLDLAGKQGACVNVFRDRFSCFAPLVEAKDGAADRPDAADRAEESSAQTATAASKKATAFAQDEDEIDYGDDDDDMGDGNDEATASGAAAASTSTSDPSAAAFPTEAADTYLFVLDTEGVCEIYLLPELELRWRSFGLPALADRLDLQPKRAYHLAPEQAVTITEARLCHLEDVVHLVLITGNNILLAYEANPHPERDLDPSGTKEDDAKLLSLGFNKVFARALFVSSPSGYVNGDDHASRDCVMLKPFGRRSDSHDSVAVLGGGNTLAKSWLLSTPKRGLRLIDCDVGFAPDDLCWFGLDSGDLAVCSEGSVYLSSFEHEEDFDSEWTVRSLRTGRFYTKVVSHDMTGCIVAASANEQPFVLYDDENEPITDPADDKTPTSSLRGALELFTDEDKHEPIHGWEFEANETVTCLEVVTLDSPSVPGGRKSFIAAGTVVFQGEDRAARGSTYLFDVIEVVTDAADPSNRFRLKLLCKDDSKAPVTAIADINGFLISTSGQKLYVRALEKEEWLISIAFLDLAFYVTSIRVLKNFILLSDIKKSLWFVGFQEDPYRFVILGKDHADQYATTGNFLVNKDRLSLVSTSAAGGGTLGGKEGVFRMFEYNPMVPSSMGGQRLLLKTEFQSAAAEAVASYTVKGRWLSRHERRGAESVRSKIIYAMNNGSIETLAAVDEQVIKRLQLLQQGQLVRSVRHFAALNPRSFRTVRNDQVSRPLVKGIVDDRLLSIFASLPRPKMLEAVGTLSGLFNGLDEVEVRDSDFEDAEGAGEEEEEEEKQERKRLQIEEKTRRKREAKRADLILTDLVKMRAGFECL